MDPNEFTSLDVKWSHPTHTLKTKIGNILKYNTYEHTCMKKTHDLHKRTTINKTIQPKKKTKKESAKNVTHRQTYKQENLHFTQTNNNK